MGRRHDWQPDGRRGAGYLRWHRGAYGIEGLMTLTFGSLFAGIGGFDLGFERAGMTPLWQVEIDDYCNRVLEKHWPDVKRYRDVREIHGAITHTEQIRRNRQGQHEKRGQAGSKSRDKSAPRYSEPGHTGYPCPACLEPVDVICGGFPCQPHSLAGKRKGAGDDRDLWPEYRRLIDELRPRWVVAENVPGIRTTILDAVLSDLEGMGYSWETAIIPACAVDAPHRRDRVWIVAHSLGKQDNSEHERRRRLSEQQRRTIGTGGKATRPQNGQASDNGVSGYGQAVADSDATRLAQRQGKPGDNGQEQPAAIGRSRWLAEPGVGGLADGLPPGLAGLRWLPEPGVGRVTTGVPERVDKLKSLGNAVVPQVAEFIGRLIVEVEAIT